MSTLVNLETQTSISRSANGFVLRPMKPSDIIPVKAAHEELFPIQYEHDFFHKAVHGQDRIHSWVAERYESTKEGEVTLAGFVTVKLLDVYELDDNDSDLVGWEAWQQVRALSASCFGGPAASSCNLQVAYILTIGVLPACQTSGLGRRLIDQVISHFTTKTPMCRAIYLHVISHNNVAIKFYQNLHFHLHRYLPHFYYITGEKAPSPNRKHYDALLFVRYINDGRPPFSILEVCTNSVESIQKLIQRVIRCCRVWNGLCDSRIRRVGTSSAIEKD